jgi:hypothetical protein
MKALNDIAYKYNSIQFNSIQIFIELNSKCKPNTWNGIQTQLKKNRMHIGVKGIEN